MNYVSWLEYKTLRKASPLRVQRYDTFLYSIVLKIERNSYSDNVKMYFIIWWRHLREILDAILYSVLPSWTSFHVQTLEEYLEFLHWMHSTRRAQDMHHLGALINTVDNTERKKGKTIPVTDRGSP
jgi:hypothetical protein